MPDLQVEDDAAGAAAARLRDLASCAVEADPAEAAAATGHARFRDAAAVVGSEHMRGAEAVRAEALALARLLEDSVDRLTDADRRLARGRTSKADGR